MTISYDHVVNKDALYQSNAPDLKRKFESQRFALNRYLHGLGFKLNSQSTSDRMRTYVNNSTSIIMLENNNDETIVRSHIITGPNEENLVNRIETFYGNLEIKERRQQYRV